jgi:hypothetical protein
METVEESVVPGVRAGREYTEYPTTSFSFAMNLKLL